MPSYWHDHIHLTTPDALKTAEFYETMFNARRVTTRESADGRTTSVQLDLGGSRVLVAERIAEPEQAQSPSGTVHGLEHFGLGTDNLEAAVAELKAKGVKFRDEIRVAPTGAKICFLWAPENVLIELVERSS
ncbi:VOC family protein [Chloroflexota bacterium]